MRSCASVLTLLFLQTVLGEDIWKDLEADHGVLSAGEPSATSAEIGTLRKTRNYGYYWPSSRTGGQLSIADGILNQLLRQYNWDISAVLTSIERRFNLRVSANADLLTRLNAIVSAANAGLSFTGYGNFRSVVNSVAERLSAMIRANSQQTAQGNANGQLPWSGQRPNSNTLQQSWGSLQSGGNWGSGPQQARPPQGNNWPQTPTTPSGQSSSGSSSGPTWQDSRDYWPQRSPSTSDPWTGPQPMVHIPANKTPVYGSKPLFTIS